MDQSTLIKIARLRTLAARRGKAFDVVRFVGDQRFAHQVLTDVMDTDDEDVLVLGLQLMQVLGLGPAVPVPSAPAAAAPATAGTEPVVQEKTERYVGRLR